MMICSFFSIKQDDGTLGYSTMRRGGEGNKVRMIEINKYRSGKRQGG